MGTPENKVKEFIKKWMKLWYPDAFTFAPPGTPFFGRNGLPDRMWIMKAMEGSVVVAIEAKSENGKPTDLQLNTLNKLAKQGVVAAVVVGKDLGHLERIKEEIERRLKANPRV
jgi:hypothetical protein